MACAIIYVWLSLAAAGADSVTLSHGTVLTGQVQSVTLKIAGRRQEISREDIRSMTLAGTPTGDTVVVLADKQLTGEFLRVTIKTAAATTTVERDMMQTMALASADSQSSAAASQPAHAEAAAAKAAELQSFSDKITHKTGFVLHAVVTSAQLDERTYLRNDMESLAVGAGDTVTLSSGKSVSGQLKSLRVRLGAGMVDLDRSEVTAVQLAKVSADNPPPAQSSDKPTAEQTANLAASGAAKEECVRKVAALKSEALNKIAGKYTQTVADLDGDLRIADAEAARAQERVASQRTLIENLRKDLDRTPYNRRANLESRIREANTAIVTATEHYRKASDKYNKAKPRKDKLLALRKADEQAVVRWADALVSALSRAANKNGLLILAGVPLDSAASKTMYEAMMTQPPAVFALEEDAPKHTGKADAKPAGKKTAPKAAPKDAPAPGE